nr:hypothetical protein GCM10020093_019490 [Planobispora longispora]
MRSSDEIGKAVHAAVEAAAWAPSVHNTQPWSFVVSGEEISVRFDSDRRLAVEDPAGREMLISCGAALFNVRLALGEMGYEPVVRILPDPDRRALLATVRLGSAVAAGAAGEHIRLLHAQIERRRTHRGDFTGEELPERFVEAVCGQAAAEGAVDAGAFGGRGAGAGGPDSGCSGGPGPGSGFFAGGVALVALAGQQAARWCACRCLPA